MGCRPDSRRPPPPPSPLSPHRHRCTCRLTRPAPSRRSSKLGEIPLRPALRTPKPPHRRRSSRRLQCPGTTASARTSAAGSSGSTAAPHAKRAPCACCAPSGSWTPPRIISSVMPRGRNICPTCMCGQWRCVPRVATNGAAHQRMASDTHLGCVGACLRTPRAGLYTMPGKAAQTQLCAPVRGRGNAPTHGRADRTRAQHTGSTGATPRSTRDT